MTIDLQSLPLEGPQSCLAPGRGDDGRDRDRADRGRSRLILWKPRTTVSSVMRPPITCWATRWPMTSISSISARISFASGRSFRAAQGVFLKRGKDSHFLAKSFIYPLLASPFIWLFGTNGFMVFHALLMTLSFACAYAFLVARSHPVAALIFALAFVFVSVAPVYMVQIAPDFFNFAIVLFAFFFWCYKEAIGDSTRRTAGHLFETWLLGPRSDIVAAAVLGVAMFSKPTQIMLIAPLLVSACCGGNGGAVSRSAACSLRWRSACSSSTPR